MRRVADRTERRAAPPAQRQPGGPRTLAMPANRYVSAGPAHDTDQTDVAPAPVGSLALELGVPVALLSRRQGRRWSLAAWSLHIGILAMMRIRFRYQLSGVAYGSFLDLERIVPRRWAR